MAAWEKANPEKRKAARAARYRANSEKIKASNAAWAIKNQEKVRAAKAKWYRANSEKIKAATAARYSANPEKIKAATAAWAAANPKKVNAWRAIPSNKIASNLRSRISNVLAGRKKFLTCLESVGCSFEELRSWLEGGWEPGMSWSNYGSAWEVDHRRPCSSFDLSRPEEQRRCFHFLNLQPLWKSDNRRKSDSYHANATIE